MQKTFPYEFSKVHVLAILVVIAWLADVLISVSTTLKNKIQVFLFVVENFYLFSDNVTVNFNDWWIFRFVIFLNFHCDKNENHFHDKTTSMAIFLFFYGLGRRSQEIKVSLSQKVITWHNLAENVQDLVDYSKECIYLSS